MMRTKKKLFIRRHNVWRERLAMRLSDVSVDVDMTMEWHVLMTSPAGDCSLVVAEMWFQRLSAELCRAASARWTQCAVNHGAQHVYRPIRTLSELDRADTATVASSLLQHGADISQRSDSWQWQWQRAAMDWNDLRLTAQLIHLVCCWLTLGNCAFVYVRAFFHMYSLQLDVRNLSLGCAIWWMLTR